LLRTHICATLGVVTVTDRFASDQSQQANTHIINTLNS